MTSVHGPSIRTDGGNKIKEKYARVVVTISKPSARIFSLILVTVGADMVVIGPDRESPQTHHISAARVLDRGHPPVPRPVQLYVPLPPPSSASSARVGTVAVGGWCCACIYYSSWTFRLSAMPIIRHVRFPSAAHVASWPRCAHTASTPVPRVYPASVAPPGSILPRQDSCWGRPQTGDRRTCSQRRPRRRKVAGDWWW
jgi:hypothetical protein